MNVHQPVAKGKSKVPREGYRKELIYRTFREKGEKHAREHARKMRIADSSFKRWMSDWRKSAVLPADYLSIRDLQKISGETIRGLRGPTPIKSGDRTIGILVPLKAADPERLAAVLARAESLARGRDAARDDEALRGFGDVDPVNWSVEEVRKLMAETRQR